MCATKIIFVDFIFHNFNFSSIFFFFFIIFLSCSTNVNAWVFTLKNIESTGVNNHIFKVQQWPQFIVAYDDPLNNVLQRKALYLCLAYIRAQFWNTCFPRYLGERPRSSSSDKICFVVETINFRFIVFRILRVHYTQSWYLNSGETDEERARNVIPSTMRTLHDVDDVKHVFCLKYGSWGIDILKMQWFSLFFEPLEFGFRWIPEN